MIRFVAKTVRTFHTEEQFNDFMEYIKDYVPEKVHSDLVNHGESVRNDTECDGSLVSSAWVIQKGDLQ
jgi:hypothetical protein